MTSKNKGKQHVKRRSVSFEDETGGMNTDEDREVKRNERRRVEARAAIEVSFFFPLECAVDKLTGLFSLEMS